MIKKIIYILPCFLMGCVIDFTQPKEIKTKNCNVYHCSYAFKNSWVTILADKNFAEAGDVIKFNGQKIELVIENPQ